ncbi:glycosyltransferase [Ornithinimicrobium sp. LYQ121]|uniref:glycosyltransferase n=1 Tax=Ornithinimicrobium sp. LYQ121 TaxID=3378801 RepID=UPI003853C58C
MRTVDVAPINLDRLDHLIGPERWAQVQRGVQAARAGLDGRVFWHVSSTATGGGVAEMLQILLAYVRGTGIDARWLVLDCPGPFFSITKRLHNALHGVPGDGGPLGEQERSRYEAALAPNAEDLRSRLGPGDVVQLHDPQTAGLIPHLADRGVSVLWRSHIGCDKTNEHTARGWAFLEPYLREAQAVVVSRPVYAPPSVPRERVVVIAPSIDPFAAKNAPIPNGDVQRTLVRAGVVEGMDDALEVRFPRRDGSTGTVRRHTGAMVAGGPVPADTPYVLQVSRWDRLKDMPGVMRAFIGNADARAAAHLVLAGPAVEGVSDDPEGVEVLQECVQLWEELDPAGRARVHLAALPMDDVDENAHIVNALQRAAAIVVQKSLQEGFGLTVTEAMWKSRPMIASAVGGIQDQIEDGVSGLLLADPSNLAGAGQLMARLLTDDALAAQLGAGARERVYQQFLPDRHLLQYERLLAAMPLAPRPPGGTTT